MPSKRMMTRYKITKKCIVLSLITFTAAICIFLILMDENGINKQSQFTAACTNANQNWVHHNQTFINQRILAKLKGLSLNNSIYIANYKWKEVISHIFIYSAFNDSCDFPGQKTSQPCVKIISVILRGHSVFESIQPQLVCFIKGKNDIKRTSIVKATVIKEHHERCFGAAFIDCLTNQDHPTAVSISKSTQTTTINWIPVFKYKPQMKELAVCVRPLYGPFNSSFQLLEFISYYTEAGVQQFYFYDQSIVPEIYYLLKLLSRHGKANISLLQWKVPLDNELLHENGQLAHIQDCVLRCRNEFKHVILVDIDEYIVPRQQNNLIEMLNYLDKKYANAGTYVFPMALFCNEYLHQTKRNSLHSVLPFITHINTWRQKTLWYYQERSKVIIKPNAVKIGAIHFTWEHVNKYREIQVSADVAIVQHYRSCCGMRQTWILHLLSFQVLDDKITKDESLLVYKSKMLENPIIKLLWKLLL